MKIRNIPLLLIILLILLNIFLAIYSTPVTDYGDTNAYIALSKKFLGENIVDNQAHRAPLYSLLLAIIIKVFGIPLTFRVTIIIQYALVFATALLIYSLFLRIFEKPFLPFIISILFNLSFSTIYFANILLTEILTIFLLFISLHFLLKYFDRNKFIYLIIIGLSIGLLSLARFNVVPIIFSFLILLSYLIFIEQRNGFKKGLIRLIIFLIPYLLVLNLWCLYNYNENGFYGLFPGGSTMTSRNVIVSSIRPYNKVTKDYQPVLDIFIKARDMYTSQQQMDIKGSFHSDDKYGIIDDLNCGYVIYGFAYPDLMRYFDLKANDGEYQMNNKLKGFYNEIARENAGFLWKLKFYSLLNSFRASTSGLLPSSYGKINLNILPAFIIKLNKIITFFISCFVFISFFFFVYQVIKYCRVKPDFLLLVFFTLVFSFWMINFLFMTESNANRFKFPVEPLIIGLFFYYLQKLGRWFIRFKHHKLIINRKTPLMLF
jgi:hypothetical protein